MKKLLIVSVAVLLVCTLIPTDASGYHFARRWQSWNRINASDGWEWKKFGEVDLSSDVDVLEIAYREAGTKLDKILITTDLDYVPPEDRDESKVITQGEKIYLEAEAVNKNSKKFSPFKVKSDNKASKGKYIEVPNGKGNNYRFVPSKGRAKYKFNLSGKAAIWMRVHTPSSSDDSFWVKIDKETPPRRSRKINANGKEYYLGLNPTTANKYKSFPKAKIKMNAQAEVESVSSIDMSKKLPPPGNQGSQGSCTAWAAAYAYKTYQEQFDHNWSVDTKDHQFSPAYVYNQINDGVDRGAQMYEPFDLMEEQGVCPLSVMPYNENDYTTQPTQRQREIASEYKAKSWGTISAGSVSEIKSHLAGEDLVSIGVPVYPDFNVSESNPVYDDTSGQLQGYHAITLVGYDESKNAFKFINSWGQNWGFDGYGWIGYNIIRNHQIKGYVMTDIKTNDGDDDDDPDPEPEPDPNPTNIAVNKPIVASSNYSNYYPSNAVDGDTSTFWAARSSYDRWIYINLEGNKNISSMKIKWSKRNYPRKYYLQKWTGWNWDTVKTINSNGDWDEISTSFSAQYIRIYCTERNSYYYTMYEWQIFGQ